MITAKRSFGKTVGKVNSNNLLMLGGVATVGVAQTFILREFVDKTNGSIVKPLGKFGNASVLAGVIGGGLATVAALASMFNINLPVVPKLGKDTQMLALCYGVPALASSVAMTMLSPVTPAQSTPTYVKVRPMYANKAVQVRQPSGSVATPTAVVQGKKGLLTYDTNGVL